MGIYLNGRNFVPMGYINRISSNMEVLLSSSDELRGMIDYISDIVSNDLSVVLHTLSSGDNEFTGTNSFRKIEVSSVSVSSMQARDINSIEEGEEYDIFVNTDEKQYQFSYSSFIASVSSMILPSIMSSLTGNTIITFSDGDVQQYMWTGTISPETMIQENLRNSDGTWRESPTTVKLGTNVNVISPETFRNCGTLEKVRIPGSVTSIGGSAFDSCTSLTSVTIPNSVTSIGIRAFFDCTSLTSVTIPNSVTSIEANAFYNCTSLMSVTIPVSVMSIGNSAFYNCLNLASLIFKDMRSTKDVFEKFENYTNWGISTDKIQVDTTITP